MPVPSSGTVPLFTVPASLCNVTFWNIGTGIAYIGVGTSPTTAPPLTSSNGLTCHSIPTSFSTYTGSRGAYLWATSNGTASSVQFIISTDQ
ncbi:MAG TPA: hypothetical protein VGR89_15690 [Puia sp.]|nr:hypothetical protein [Puia sp.]